MPFVSPWPRVDTPNCLVTEAVIDHGRLFGDKPAVIDGDTGRTLTYRELADSVDRVAAGLASHGVRPGDIVALACPNSCDFLLGFYGTLRAGATVSTLSPLYTADEMQHQAHDCGARFAITTPELAERLRTAVQRVFEFGKSLEQILADAGEPPILDLDARTAIAVLPYSSGTTARPKGVMLTHANLIATVEQMLAMGEFQNDDVLVNMMPLYHAGAMNAFMSPVLCAGGTMVLMKRFDFETWLSLCERYRATRLAMPPPLVLAITKSPIWERYRLDSLRAAVCGAAPLGADLQRAFEERTGLLLRQVWGMTEITSPGTVVPHDRAKRKFGGAGYLLPSSEGRIVDPVTLRDLGANETDELWYRGPNVMKGYWNQPEATAQSLVEGGWLRTGDLGYFDEDGCLFLVDRLKEVIKYKALQVPPAELEDVLQAHPAVLDAAVIGIPDAECGEIPKAFVVLRSEGAATAAELMEFVAGRVAPYKKVRAIEFINAIPKSPSGKILRRVLAEKAQASAAS